MTKTNNIISINGKHYDAISGQPIAGHAISRSRPKKSIDGVVRPEVNSKTKPLTSSKPAVMDISKPAHTVGQPAKLRKPHASHTLMRQAVKKPSAKRLSKLKAQTPTDVLADKAELAVVPKLSIAKVDEKREARAKHIARSKLISRFGEIKMPSGLHLAPAVTPAMSLSLPMRSFTTPKYARAPLPHQKSMDIFQRALLKANSHEQPKPSRSAHKRAARKHTKSHRLANVSSAALAVILVGGFLAYQNVANMTVRIASVNAGFAASLPAYRPAGFSVGKFAYSPGNVTVNFHSNSDARHFALIEKPSSWDSETLLNDYVATAAKTYQTVQTAGRTVYIYGNNSATWVADGVWYRVDGQNSLSSNQLVNLASSM